MAKDAFYKNKIVTKVEYWISDCSSPDSLFWARLRVFDDRTADVNFNNDLGCYGFDSEIYAGYFLSEDEYRRFNKLDEEDARFIGIELSEVTPPISWRDLDNDTFIYYGTY